MSVGDFVRTPPGTYHSVSCTGPSRLAYLSIDCFTAGPPTAEPSWEAHVRVMCQTNGWDFDTVRLGEVPSQHRVTVATPGPRGLSSPPSQLHTRTPMIVHLADIEVEPQSYADYRPIFETSRLNVTHVRIHPGETVPAHTHQDEDQVYHVVSGSGLRGARYATDRCRPRHQRAHPAGYRARHHQHRHGAARLRVLRGIHPGARMTEFQRDRLRVVALPSRADIGQAAADHVAGRIRGLLAVAAHGACGVRRRGIAAGVPGRAGAGGGHRLVTRGGVPPGRVRGPAAG